MINQKNYIITNIIYFMYYIMYILILIFTKY